MSLSCQHASDILIYLLFSNLCRLPSPLVLQGSGLQPALKSVRASKAMSSLQFFVELLTGDFFLLCIDLAFKDKGHDIYRGIRSLGSFRMGVQFLCLDLDGSY
jgi:hypothetical protein